MILSAKNSKKRQPPSTWIGRFAPSPTGPLHLGSLVTALASYLIAKQQAGRWLVRIEDLDPPREIAGASQSILTSLQDFGLYWDNSVTYQSARSKIYQQKLQELTASKIVYRCDCSRKAIENRNAGIYDGFCRDRMPSAKKEHAIRIKFASGFSSFNDQILGQCQFEGETDKQDFIIKRRDGLFAYQLALVVDDIEQGVNHVVRGEDILDSTPRQNFLYHCFDQSTPLYYHVPLVKDKTGIKLSKRSGALAVNKNKASQLLLQALQHLGQKTDQAMLDAKPREIIRFYEKNWQINSLTNKQSH